MARKVFISSDMSNDERLIDVSEKNPQSALMWPWILTAFDDWGRAIASPKRLKSSIFPMIKTVTTELIAESLQHYEAYGLIVLYEIEGKPYMCIPENKWYKYQTHMKRTNRRPGKDKMNSDYPPPQESPRGFAGDSGAPQFPVPSPSPSPYITTTTEGETVDEVHRKVFGTMMMNGLMSDFIRRVKAQGYTDAFIRELMLETGESGTKPSLRLMESIFERWDREKIFTRSEARRRKKELQVLKGGQSDAKYRTSSERSDNEYDSLSL